MKIFLLLLVLAMLACCCGFKKYVWFISIGYGAAIAVLGAALLIIYNDVLSIGTILFSALFVCYGIRLSGYLAYRELKSSSYNKLMKKEIKQNDEVSLVGQIGIWITAALLYVLEVSPVFFRLQNAKKTDVLTMVALIISVIGFILESTADIEKNIAKKNNPKRFVDQGLFRIVRCPNYFGEMLIWTGVFISGINIYSSVWQWTAAICGYLGIIYVMFSGARRLEIRQDKNYGDDPEYISYKEKTPIMLPFLPVYSVKKYTWLVG